MKYKVNLEEIEFHEIPEWNSSPIASLINNGVLIPVEEKEFPQLGDTYFSIGSSGTIKQLKFHDVRNSLKNMEYRKKTNNVFRTLAEAEEYKNEWLNQ